MHLYGQQFGGVLEKNSFTSSFLGKNEKKSNVFEEIWFLRKKILSKCRRLQTGLGTLKNIKHLILSKIQIFNAIFKNYIFPSFLKIICSTRKITV